MAKEVAETPVKQKPSLSFGEDEAKGIKGKTVGDSCVFEVKGKITEIRSPGDWEKTKANQYRLEVEDMKYMGSRRTK